MPNISHFTQDFCFSFFFPSSAEDLQNIYFSIILYSSLFFYLTQTVSRFTVEPTCRMSTYLSLYSFTVVNLPYILTDCFNEPGAADGWGLLR